MCLKQMFTKEILLVFFALKLLYGVQLPALQAGLVAPGITVVSVT